MEALGLLPQIAHGDLVERERAMNLVMADDAQER